MDDDTISRQAAYEVLTAYYHHATDVQHAALHDALSKVPSAERHGHWIDTGSGQECSVCGEIQYGYDSGRHYCPNCGAKMEGIDEQSGIM